MIFFIIMTKCSRNIKYMNMSIVNFKYEYIYHIVYL